MEENIIYDGYKDKLKNKVFRLLCTREENKDWVKLLDSIFIELSGAEKELKSINYYSMMYKLSSLRYLNFNYFRVVIFEIINLLDGSYRE